MYINHDASTYPGQEARIIHVSTTGTGRKLYALKTCATSPVATAWDNPDALRRYAANKLHQPPKRKELNHANHEH